MPSILDALVIILLILGFLIGFKRGVFSELVVFVGTILITIVAFVLKNPISYFFYTYLPFWDFNGMPFMMIFVYELIAFLLVYSILYAVLRFLMSGTKIFEKVLTTTVILGIPSKILGGIVGVLQYYIVAFIVLFIIAVQPFYPVTSWNESTIASKVLYDTPLLSKVTNKLVVSVQKIFKMADNYSKNHSEQELTYEALDIMLDNKIISVNSAELLVDNGKLKVNGMSTLINKYKE